MDAKTCPRGTKKVGNKCVRTRAVNARATEFERLRRKWTVDATREFKGKKVRMIGWMTAKEMKDLEWSHSAPVIEFEDGSYIVAQMDDEGNDAGALLTSSKKVPLLPVIR